jgi:hypothetical protein
VQETAEAACKHKFVSQEINQNGKGLKISISVLSAKISLISKF